MKNCILILALLIVGCRNLQSQQGQFTNTDKIDSVKETSLLDGFGEIEVRAEQIFEESYICLLCRKISTNQNNALAYDLLKSFDGQYPFDIDLLDNELFTNRIKHLLGDSRFTFMQKYFEVQTPMSVTQSVFIARGCKAHECDSTNFTLIYDIKNNKFYVFIVDNCIVSIYYESEHYKSISITHTYQSILNSEIFPSYICDELFICLSDTAYSKALQEDFEKWPSSKKDTFNMIKNALKNQ